MTAPMQLPSFYVRQKFAMTTNRYELYAIAPDGGYGQLMGVAQQKRLKLKEEVVFFTDESRTRRVFSFKARSVMELNAGYDVFDEAGTQIGFFRKDFGRSLMRSTYHLEGPGYTAVGQERSEAIAIIRRFLEIPFLPVHFDFHDPAGQLLLSSERQATVRDRYTVQVPDPRVDFRVAAAVAVGLDALMGR